MAETAVNFGQIEIGRRCIVPFEDFGPTVVEKLHAMPRVCFKRNPETNRMRKHTSITNAIGADEMYYFIPPATTVTEIDDE